jgi:DNA-binding transcriptional MerR regulator
LLLGPTSWPVDPACLLLPREGQGRIRSLTLPLGETQSGCVNSTLPIGDFSRATHLSVKMLRHYHEIGLLEPVDVGTATGYRRYGSEQIVAAQIIRRLRDLDMPLDDIRIVLQAPDVETRNRVIVNHLARLESSLARTQEAVTSRVLPRRPGNPRQLLVENRSWMADLPNPAHAPTRKLVREQRPGRIGGAAREPCRMGTVSHFDRMSKSCCG